MLDHTQADTMLLHSQLTMSRLLLIHYWDMGMQEFHDLILFRLSYPQ